MGWSILPLLFSRIRFRLPHIVSLILPAAVILLSGACSVKYYLPSPGVPAENRFAIVKADSLVLAIRPQNYVGNNQQLNNRFFSILIRVKNNGFAKRRIEPGSFSILVNERQYDHIPLDYLLADLRQASLLSNYQDPFALADDQTYIKEDSRQQELYYELIANSFSFGEILPGAIKEGYLFYNNKIDSADGFTVDVLGNSTGFIKSK